MSDHIIAVYSIMYPIETICDGKRMLKNPENSSIIGTVPKVQLRRFKGSCQLITEIYLNAYDVKKAESDMTHCECLYLARVVALSFKC